MANRAQTIEQIRREVYGKQQTFQNFAFAVNREEDVDVDARTVKLAFASDNPIDNWYYGAIKLNFEKKAVRAERLKNGMAVLMDHNTRDQIGVVIDYSFDEDGIARATVQFADDQRSEDVFRSIQQGIRRHVSVGFMIWQLDLESKSKDKASVYIANDWEPYEISIVAVPADTSVGVGRSLEDEEDDNDEQVPTPKQTRAISTQEENKMTPEEIAAQKAADEQRALELADTRRKDVLAFADIYGEREMAADLLLANPAATQEDIRQAIKTKRDAIPQPILPTEDPAAVAARAGVKTELARSLPRHRSVTAFKGEGGTERAYRFGMWLLGRALYDPNAAICGTAREFCEKNGLTRAMSEGVNETGGYTVPAEFSNDIIDLREQYGVFRRNAKIVPMSSDVLVIPRRVSGLTAYFVAEGGSITASDKGWDQVQLTAQKLAVLARYSSEVSEDSIIDFASDMASEIAFAFANKEDECGFNGDGTSTYGGMTGVRQRLLDLYTTTGGVGLKLGTGNAYSELLLTDFEGTVGLLPEYADTEAAAWYVHRSFYWNVMVKVMLASGGVTAAEIEDARKQRYMGYRVVFSQVMPKTEANGQVCALLGDLSKAAMLGTRRDTSIATSEHSRFANDQIEVRGTQRFHINVHSVGDATNAGPIVGLITANA